MGDHDMAPFNAEQSAQLYSKYTPLESIWDYLRTQRIIALPSFEENR